MLRTLDFKSLDFGHRSLAFLRVLSWIDEPALLQQNCSPKEVLLLDKTGKAHALDVSINAQGKLVLDDSEWSEFEELARLLVTIFSLLFCFRAYFRAHWDVGASLKSVLLHVGTLKEILYKQGA